MENKYCWRCEMEVPFLNEEEFRQILELYRKCMRQTKNHRKSTGAALQETPMDSIFAPVRDAYEKITGYKDMHQNAIMHHRLSELGPDCPGCRKPLRTPKAKLCPSCGWKGEV